MTKKEEIYGILPCGIRDALEKENLDFGAVTEICIRAGKPVYVNAGGREIRTGYLPGKEELKDILNYMSRYST